jgi:hypothetical protein
MIGSDRHRSFLDAENAADDAAGHARALTKILSKAKKDGVVVFVRLNDADEPVELRTMEIEVLAHRGRAVIGKDE